MDGTSFNDPDIPAPGEGFFYLVQGQSFDCGLGTLGYDSDEAARSNGDPGACGGVLTTDTHPDGETATAGTVTGTLSDVLSSDDAVEAITEQISKGGKPNLRYSFLEHRWSFQLPVGSRVELHVEGFRTSSTDGDDFAFEYSTDAGGTWAPVSLGSLPFSDRDSDLQGRSPAAS